MKIVKLQNCPNEDEFISYVDEKGDEYTEIAPTGLFKCVDDQLAKHNLELYLGENENLDIFMTIKTRVEKQSLYSKILNSIERSKMWA